MSKCECCGCPSQFEDEGEPCDCIGELARCHCGNQVCWAHHVDMPEDCDDPQCAWYGEVAR